MIDEKRVRMMTRAAGLKKKQNRGIFTARSFFGGDFVALQAIKTFICVTICYVIAAALWLLGKGEEFSTQYTLDEMAGTLKAMLFIYLLLIILSIALTVFVYTRRYWDAKKAHTDYRTTIKKIDKYYRRQDEKARALSANADSDEEPIRIVIS